MGEGGNIKGVSPAIRPPEKTLIALKLAILEQCSYSFFQFLDPLLRYEQDKHPLHQWAQQITEKATWILTLTCSTL